MITFEVLAQKAIRRFKQIENAEKRAYRMAIGRTAKDIKGRMVKGVTQNKNPVSLTGLYPMSQLQKELRGKPYGGKWGKSAKVFFRGSSIDRMVATATYPEGVKRYFARWQTPGYRIDANKAAKLLAFARLRKGKRPDVYSALEDRIIRGLYAEGDKVGVKPEWHDSAAPAQNAQPPREIIGPSLLRWGAHDLEGKLKIFLNKVYER